MNGNNNERPRMTKEEYDKLTALRENSRKRKQRKDLIITLTCLGCVVLCVAMSAALFSPLYMKSGYSDPSEIFGEADTVPPMPTKPSETEPKPNDPTAPTSPSTPEPQTNRVSLIAAGDNLIHQAILDDAKKRAGGTGYNFIDMYDGVKDIIAAADVAYVNQETINAGADFGIDAYPNFNTPWEAGDTLVELGFNTVNVASNHMMDKGTAALEASNRYWNSKPVTVLGAYTKKDYDDIRVQEVNGIKIAWLSYTEFMNGSKDVEAGSDTVIPFLKESDVRRQAERAKRAGDIVIASVHWGTDSSLKVTDNQKRYAQIMADCGVDVIIGTHSHTLQPVEWITSSDGTHKTLCYYSLGNLISTMHEYYNMVGGIATFDIVKKDGKVSVENVGVIPTMCHYSYDRDALQIYTLENYNNDLAQSHGSQLKAAQYGDFDYDTLKALATTAVDKEFLPDFYN